MPFLVVFGGDHLRSTSGIICGSGSSAVQFGDHLRLGIICGAVQIASSTNMAYNKPGKSFLRHINQQHMRRCFNFSFVSNRNDLFGAYLRARTFRV